MKKILAAILAAAMVMSFAACGDSSSKSDASSKSSASSAADSSKADASSKNEASDFIGAWTITKFIKADGTEMTIDAYAAENGTTTEALKMTIVYEGNGTYKEYAEGKQSGEGTYTVNGNKATMKDVKDGKTEDGEIDGTKLIVTSSESKDKIVCEKDASFVVPQQTETQPAETQPEETQPEGNEGGEEGGNEE